MGGAHSHVQGVDERLVGPTPLVRAVLVGVIVALGAAAVAGLWWLWPSGDLTRSIEFFGEDVTVHDAAVREVGEPCPILVADPENPQPSGERPAGCDTLRVEPRSGPEAGADVELQVPPEASRSGLRAGDTVRVFRIPAPGEPVYAFLGVERNPSLALLAGMAALVVVVVARWRGLLAIVGLGFSAAVIWWFMLPALVEGKPGLWVALTAATAILFVVLYLAHGVSIRTSVALAGTLAGIAVTAVLALWSTGGARLSGLGGEAGDTLLLQAGELGFRELLVCAVVIAGLGVLNDVTITQASAVWELRAAAPAATRRELFSSGMRIGRDHIASTIYTIVFAYAGTSLGLLVLVSLYDRPVADMLLDEGVAEEVVRTLTSTVGLVLAVPITTVLAVLTVRPPVVAGPPRSDAAVAHVDRA